MKDTKEFVKTIAHPKCEILNMKLYVECIRGAVCFGIYGTYVDGTPIEDWADTQEEAEEQALSYLEDIYNGSAAREMAESRATERAEGSGTYGVEKYG